MSLDEGGNGAGERTLANEPTRETRGLRWGGSDEMNDVRTGEIARVTGLRQKEPIRQVGIRARGANSTEEARAD